MSFGGGSNKGRNTGGVKDIFNTLNTGGAPLTPKSPSASVLLSGLMGLRPQRNPALSTGFASGSSSGLGRRPALSKRTIFGGM